MVKQHIEAWLSEGRSVEEMAEREGVHPSTVGYWLRKHGLQASGFEKHRAKGPLERERLEELVESGLSIRRIAAAVDRGPTAVRHWLEHHGLETAQAERRRALAHARAGDASPLQTLACPHHGATTHQRAADGRYRCLTCRSEAVTRRRRKVKATLVAEAGGRCALCGYDRCQAALQFHHVERATKEFHLGLGGESRSLDRARAEARKCVLLCANCHAEVEVGAASIPRPV